MLEDYQTKALVALAVDIGTVGVACGIARAIALLCCNHRLLVRFVLVTAIAAVWFHYMFTVHAHHGFWVGLPHALAALPWWCGMSVATVMDWRRMRGRP